MVNERRKRDRNKKSRRNEKSVKRDFEIFSKGVERLEQIRNELNSLNTVGFEAEVISIKSKLNNVSYIPEIEKELRNLKEKIAGTFKQKNDEIVRDIHSKIYGKIKELRKDIPEKHYRIHKKIRELEKQIPDRNKLQKRIKELEKEIKVVEEVPKIEQQLESLKSFINKQKEEEKRKKEILKKLDPQTNILINDKFNLTLNEIKAELSDKIKKKELDVARKLYNDLNARKLNFKKQYEKLENDFEKKYKNIVRTSLREEVKNKLKDLLNKKTESLKQELNEDNIKKLELEKQNLRDNFKKIFLQILNRLKLQGKNLKDIEKQKLLEIEEKKKNLEKFGKKLQSDSAKKLLADREKIQDTENRKLTKLKSDEQENIKKLASEEKKLKIIEKQKLSEIELLKNNLKKSKKMFQLEAGEKLKELNERLTNQNKIIRDNVNEKLAKKIKIKAAFLEHYYKKNLEKEKNELKEHYDEQVLVHQTLLDKKMHEHLTEKTRNLHNKFEARKKIELEKIDKTRKMIDNQRGLLSRIKDRLKAVIGRVKKEEDKYKEELINKLEKEKQIAIQNEIKKQHGIIKEQLEKEFNERLKLEIKVKEAEFNKRKANLTLEIQKKAKQLFA